MASRDPQRPNVVFFFTDQQRWDTSAMFGNPLDLTPNFDRFAQANTHCPLAFTCQPVCGPARSCLQTGQWAARTGCHTNSHADLPTDVPLLAEQFKAAGYRTAYFGKWHLYQTLDDEGKRSLGPVPPERRGGYDHWLAANVLEFTSDAYRTRLWDNDSNPVDLPGYRVDAVTDAVIRYIDQLQQESDEPFFLMVSYIEPHHQNHLDDYPPPDGYRERYTGRWTPPDLAALPPHNENDDRAGGSTHQHLAGYWGMVKRLDEAFGRTLDALKSMSLADATVVAYSSDHGCHFKTRNSEYKRSIHESSTRIPMAIGGPGFVAGGQRPELTSLIDLPPTLLDAAGIDIPDTFDGRSIKQLVAGQDRGWPDDVYAQVSETQVGRMIRTHRWKYGIDAPHAKANKDACGETYVEQFLYDLQCDPYELNNLVNTRMHEPVRERMRERMHARMKQAGEPAAVIQAAEVRGGGPCIVEPHEVNQ